MRFSLTLLLVLAGLSGCTDPSTGDGSDAPPDDAQQDAPAAGPTTWGSHTASIAMTSLPPEGTIKVGVADDLEATIVGNSTMSCWEMHGVPPPRAGEVFANPFIDFVSPSGKMTSFEISVSGGCDATSGGPLRAVDEVDLPDEAGAWTVRIAAYGSGIQFTVTLASAA